VDLPEEAQIGGYPIMDHDDALHLDSEGRAIVLDFGAFVLIGTYCPAARDEAERVDFRETFHKTVMDRITNLTDMGRKVVWCGDLNVAPEPIDEAGAWELLKRSGPDSEEMKEWRQRSVKKMFRNLIEPSKGAFMIDVVRGFFPDRISMFTR